MCNFSPSSQHKPNVSPRTLAALAEVMRAAAALHKLELPRDLEIVLSGHHPPKWCQNCGNCWMCQDDKPLDAPTAKHDTKNNRRPDEEFFYAQHMF